MKVLMIYGSPHPDGCTATTLKEIAETLHRHGIDTEILYLGNKPIAECIACETSGEIAFRTPIHWHTFRA